LNTENGSKIEKGVSSVARKLSSSRAVTSQNIRMSDGEFEVH
jgi:hypothetical protein